MKKNKLKKPFIITVVFLPILIIIGYTAYYNLSNNNEINNNESAKNKSIEEPVKEETNTSKNIQEKEQEKLVDEITKVTEEKQKNVEIIKKETTSTNNTSSKSNIDNSLPNEITYITLKETEKASINFLLNEDGKSFSIPINLIDNNIYNVNLFKDEQSKFEFINYIIYQKLGNKAPYLIEEEAYYLEIEYQKEFYKKTFGQNPDISKIKANYHQTKKNYILVDIPKNIGSLPAYKANKLEFNNKTGIYTLYIDVIDVDKLIANGVKNHTLITMWSNTKYDIEHISRKAEIKLKIIDGETLEYNLISFEYKENK